MLYFSNRWSIYLITCWLHDIPIYLLIYCSTGILTYWLNNLLIYWLDLTWFMTEWMTCLVCIVLVGRMSVLVYFFVYLLWTLRCISNAPCIAQTARGVGSSFWRQVLKLEGWLEEENNNLGYWFGTRGNHFTIIDELWELEEELAFLSPGE